MTHKSQSASPTLQRRQALEANVLRSCRKCGAPGYWHNVDPTINPGCYAPDKVTQLGNDPVGDVCPNCGADRLAVERLGVIWVREWRVSLWAVVKDALGNILKPFTLSHWRRQ